MSVYVNGVQVLTARGSTRGALTHRLSCLAEPAELVIKFERWTGAPIWGLLELSGEGQQGSSTPPSATAPLYRGPLESPSSFFTGDSRAHPLVERLAFAIERPPPKDRSLYK